MIALQVPTGREKAVASSLDSLLIPRFLPFRRTSKRYCLKTSVETTALFPGYLFSEYLNSEVLMRLRQKTGLHARLRIVPGTLSPDVIEEIRARLDADDCAILESRAASPCSYRKGEQVIYSGMAEVEAIFDSRIKDSERVIILLRLFDRQTPVPVLLSEIRPVYA